MTRALAGTIGLLLLTAACVPAEAPQQAAPVAAPLASWNDTATKRALVDFVERVTDPNREGFVPDSARIAVFDNDGTLWAEQPASIGRLRRGLDEAPERGWIVVDMKEDWKIVFADADGADR